MTLASRVNDLAARVASEFQARGGGNPVGAIIAWPKSTAPAGWLLCDGSAFNTTTYPDLYALLGGNHVPDYRGLILVGRDSGQTEFAALGQTGGEKGHTLTTTEMPSHTHPYVDLGPVNVGGGDVPWTAGHDTPNYSRGSLDPTPTTGASGGGGAHNNLQPYRVVNWIIRAVAGVGSGGGGASALADLSDVSLSTPLALGAALVWGGSAWVPSGGPLPAPYTATWTANQLDGIFNALGQWAGAGTWTNPAAGSNQQITTSQSSTYGSYPNATADKATDHQNISGTSPTTWMQTNNDGLPGPWWKVDFGAARKLTITRIGLVSSVANAINPRNFVIEGSNDNSAWTTLLTVTNDGPAAGGGNWWSSAITGAAAYRYLRIRNSGDTTLGSGQRYLALGEIEMWGTLSAS